MLCRQTTSHKISKSNRVKNCHKIRVWNLSQIWITSLCLKSPGVRNPDGWKGKGVAIVMVKVHHHQFTLTLSVTEWQRQQERSTPWPSHRHQVLPFTFTFHEKRHWHFGHCQNSKERQEKSCSLDCLPVHVSDSHLKWWVKTIIGYIRTGVSLKKTCTKKLRRHCLRTLPICGVDFYPGAKFSATQRTPYKCYPNMSSWHITRPQN